MKNDAVAVLVEVAVLKQIGSNMYYVIRFGAHSTTTIFMDTLNALRNNLKYRSCFNF